MQPTSHRKLSIVRVGTTSLHLPMLGTVQGGYGGTTLPFPLKKEEPIKGGVEGTKFPQLHQIGVSIQMCGANKQLIISQTGDDGTATTRLSIRRPTRKPEKADFPELPKGPKSQKCQIQVVQSQGQTGTGWLQAVLKPAMVPLIVTEIGVHLMDQPMIDPWDEDGESAWDDEFDPEDERAVDPDDETDQ